jgi:hypothetical protein
MLAICLSAAIVLAARSACWSSSPAGAVAGALPAFNLVANGVINVVRSFPSSSCWWRSRPSRG